MKRPNLFAPLLLAFVSIVAVGCAEPVEEDEAAVSSEAALEESWSAATPVIFEIEAPLDLTFTRPEDWGGLEVQDPLDPNHRWRPASTSERPAVSERPAIGSGITDQLRNGFGSGSCRPRLNPFKKEIGFRCKWTF